jgi:hypothetical protein
LSVQPWMGYDVPKPLQPSWRDFKSDPSFSAAKLAT